MKYFTPLLAFGTTVLAAVDCKDSSAKIKIENSSDANINCKTVEGSIVVQGDVSEISISGPERIKGDLIVSNATNLILLSSSSISQIDGKFEITSADKLTNINFSELESVGSIEWISLSDLSDVVFGTEGVTKVNSIRISDTNLGTLDGFNIGSVDNLQLDNNSRLNKWEAGVKNITKTLSINNNSPDFTVSFPNLTSAGDLDIRGVKNFSVPLLSELNGGIAFVDNEKLESFSAPNLTEAKTSVVFTNNPSITEIDFSKLSKIGGAFTITANDELKTVDGFPKLSHIAGALNMTGDFEEIDLPSLKQVQGAFKIVSSEDISSSCDKLSSLKNAKCSGNEDDPNSKALGSNGKNKDGDDDSAAGSIGVNMVSMGALFLAAVATQLL